MRIYAGQTAEIFQAGVLNPAMNQKQGETALQTGGMIRSDSAVISQQGKSANLLANLMCQKELLQMNKDSLMKGALDEERGTVSSGLQEQLEEYEKQLEELDNQIAAEIAKQAENEPEQSHTYQKPQNKTAEESLDESAAKLTELAVSLDKTQTTEQVRIRREGDKQVCKSEMELGSTVAEHRLEKIERTERLTAQIEALLR